MARKAMTKTAKLLKFVAKKGRVTHKQMVEFVGGKGARSDYWNAQFYGSNRQDGLIGSVLKRNADGTYSVKGKLTDKKLQGPFYCAHAVLFDMYYGDGDGEF